MLNTIIFDLEGVILNTEGLWDESQKLFFDKLDIKYNSDEIKPLVAGRTLDEGTRLLKEYYNISLDENELIKLRLQYIYKLMSSKVFFIKNFLSFYEKINQLGLRSCIATSLDKQLFNQIKLSQKIIKLFNNKIYFNSELELPSKPEPHIYLFAAERVGSNPNECVVIEDSPIGISSAKNANMTCVALSTTFNSSYLVEADYIYDSFDNIDIKKIINNTQQGLIHY